MLHDLTRCAENVSRSSKRAATIPRQARRLDVAAERTSGHADLARSCCSPAMGAASPSCVLTSPGAASLSLIATDMRRQLTV